MMIKGVDHIGVCVIGFCRDKEGRVVLQKRGQHTRDEQGRWDFPGGALEFGETVEEGLRREVREEIGVEVLSSAFLGFRDVHRRLASGAPTHWIGLDFLVFVESAKVRNGEPRSIDAIQWFTRDAMPADNQLHSEIPLFLKKYADHLWW